MSELTYTRGRQNAAAEIHQIILDNYDPEINRPMSKEQYYREIALHFNSVLMQIYDKVLEIENKEDTYE